MVSKKAKSEPFDQGLLDHKLKQLEKCSEPSLLRQLVTLSVPIYISTLTNFFVQTVNFFYAGYFNSAVIAGIGLACVFINLMVFAVSTGLNSAMQSLICQSEGAGNHRSSALYVNKGRVAITLWLPLFILSSFFIQDLLISIGIELESSVVTYQFLVRMIPGLIFYCYFDHIRQYMTALGKPNTCSIIQVVTVVFHVALSWLFIVELKLDYYWLAYSSCIVYVLQFLAAYLIVSKSSEYKETWQFMGAEAF